MTRMKEFYVTVEKTQSWNVVVSAETEEEAQEKAIEELDFNYPDYSYDPEIVHLSEVTRDHE